MQSNELKAALRRSEPDIQKRTFAFAVRIIRSARSMSRDAADQMIARQIARCGTSIGANVEEAQGAPSRVDFARRMNIARTEARETLYWLRLLAETEIVPRRRLDSLISEADVIVRILVAIVKKAREKKVN